MYFSCFISSFVSFRVCGYTKDLFDAVRNQTSNRKHLLQLTERRSKDSSFDKQKTFCENFKPVRV